MKKRIFGGVIVVVMALMMLAVGASANNSATEYALWIGGTQVTSANANLAENKWSYDAATNTLTLDGYTFEGTASKVGDLVEYSSVIHSEIEGLKITDSATIKNNAENAMCISSTYGITFNGFSADLESIGAGIVAAGGITIKNTGDNEIKIKAQSTGICLENYSESHAGSFIIDGGTYDFEGQDPIMAIGGNINIKSGTIKATTSFAGIRVTNGNLAIEGGDIDIESNAHASFSIYVTDGNTEIKGGTVKLKSNKVGIFADSGNVTISGGNITIDSDDTCITTKGEITGDITGKITITGGTQRLASSTRAFVPNPDISGYTGAFTAVSATNSAGTDLDYYDESSNEDVKFFQLSNEPIDVDGSTTAKPCPPKPEFHLPIYVFGAMLASNYELTIDAEAADGGSISPEGEVKVRLGMSKTFTIKPDKGFEVESVIVDGEDIGAVEKYTFSHVFENHTISVTFKEEEWKNPYKDVDAEDDFYADVEFVTENRLMDGVSFRRFAPKGDVDRIDVIEALYRLSGGTDDKALEWATASGLVDPTAKFDAKGDITYAEALELIAAYAEYIGIDAKVIATAKTMLTAMVEDMTAELTRAEVAGYLRIFSEMAA